MVKNEGATKTKKYANLIEGFAFIIALTLFIFGVIPFVASTVDAYQRQSDQATAQVYHALFSARVSDDVEQWEGHEIRRYFNRTLDEAVLFEPKSHATGFFFLQEEQRIVALSFDEAYLYAEERGLLSHTNSDSSTDTFGSPEMFFGEGIILLSREGSSLARRVNQVYENARRRDFWEDDQAAFPSTLDKMATWIERFILRMGPRQEVIERLDQFEQYYHPTRTLYVANHRWVTHAQKGEAIDRIVFYPGISTIPEFTMTHFAPNSIQFAEIVLPKTVKNIQTGAFPEVFSVERLTLTTDTDIRVEEGALPGVISIAFIATIIDRDDSQYLIDVIFEGRPLIEITPPPAHVNPTIDLTHLRKYFAYIGLEVVSYNIEMNLTEITHSRVYIYTREGYYGYVIPIIKVP